jgi:DNA (cytosine-5)-methyltransferase 1
MNVVSLFAGCGGIDLGFNIVGHKVIFANDISKVACDTYKRNFPDTEVVCGDIREINKFPKAEILVGCYPCQGFSLAGNRNPNDQRNMLYLEFARALKQVKPKFFVAENVKGMLSLANSRIFKNMLKLYRRCGYNVKYKLMNAKHYGVPQDRERIFIVGVRKDISFEYDFPVGGFDNEHYNSLRVALNGLPRSKKDDVCRAKFSYIYMSRNRKRSWHEPSFTIQAGANHAPLHPLSSSMVRVKKDVCKFSGTRFRRLSYRECARVQSFPDRFEFSGALSNKYEQIGNAVPPLLSFFIAKNLPLVLQKKPIFSKTKHSYQSFINIKRLI